jgi:ribosomal protein L34E
MNFQSSYQDYLQTPYWKEVSRAVKKRYGFRCGVCNSPLDLCAHHRTYEHRGKELDHLDDLICLCKKCHRTFHAVEREESQKFKRKLARPKPEPIEAEPVAPSYKDKTTGTRVLDANLIKSLRICGGMTAATLKALGVDWSFTKQPHWMFKLRGRIVTEQAYQEALAGKKIRVSKKKRR